MPAPSQAGSAHSGPTRGGARKPAAPARPGRYPQRRLRPWAVALIALVAAVGIGWLIWTATVHSRPAVGGDVHVWQVVSDQQVDFTLTVDRKDPGVPVTCRVKAQATNHETVGEKVIEVGPADTRLVNVADSMRTLRRATSVSFDNCWVG